MIVRWQDLVTYYGTDLGMHRGSLEKAHQATYAVLACKWSPSDPSSVANRSGEHAEERLLHTAVWEREIPAALEARSDLDVQPMVVTLALNRSPCGHCARVLAEALERLQFDFARRFENAVFILASLGYYQSSKFGSPDHAQHHPDSGEPLWVTTAKGLERLQDSGWRLGVLSFDGAITARGRELVEFLS